MMRAVLLLVALAAVHAESSPIKKWDCAAEPPVPYETRMGEPTCWFTDRFDTREEIEAYAARWKAGDLTASIQSKSHCDCMSECKYTTKFEMSWCYVDEHCHGGFRNFKSLKCKLKRGVKWDFCRPYYDGGFGQIAAFFEAKQVWADWQALNAKEGKEPTENPCGAEPPELPAAPIEWEGQKAEAAQGKKARARSRKLRCFKNKRRLAREAKLAVREKQARAKVKADFEKDEIDMENAVFGMLRQGLKRMCMLKQRAETRLKEREQKKGLLAPKPKSQLADLGMDHPNANVTEDLGEGEKEELGDDACNIKAECEEDSVAKKVVERKEAKVGRQQAFDEATELLRKTQGLGDVKADGAPVDAPDEQVGDPPPSGDSD